MWLNVRTTRRGAALPIKKEIQDFVIATEQLYRRLSHERTLTCHEAEILRCCLEELSVIKYKPSRFDGQTVLRFE